MTLNEWKNISGLSVTQIAANIGATRACVGRYLSGQRMPNKAAIHKIYTETGGMVGPNDWYSPLPDLSCDTIKSNALRVQNHGE